MKVTKECLSIKNYILSMFESGPIKQKLETSLNDLIGLYIGQWKDFEPCLTPYHNLRHTLTVGEVSAILFSGWNLAHPERIIEPYYKYLGILAALFHDSGYIKDKGDLEGLGGKFTLIHVQRSKQIAELYLQQKGFTYEEIQLVLQIIELTDFGREIKFEGPVANFPGRNLAAIVATADLLAQASAFDYVEGLYYLYQEFEELYKFVGRDKLNDQGISTYSSYEDLLRKSPLFFKNFVFPRLAKLGHAYKYASYFFKGRNFYWEAMQYNLMTLEKYLKQGEFLDISFSSIDLDLGKNNERPRQFKLKTNRIPPSFFASKLRGLISEETLEGCSKDELCFFLRVATLLLYEQEDSYKYIQAIMELMADFLQVEASSLFIKNSDNTLKVLAATGPVANTFQHLNIPIENSLAGWVLQKGKPLYINEIDKSPAFWRQADEKVGFWSKNILAVPVFVQGQPYFVIEFVNKMQGFSSEDVLKVKVLLKLFKPILVQGD